MNKKQQVYQTDTDVDQFEISTTIESNDTIIDDSSNQKGKEGDYGCQHSRRHQRY